MDKRTSGLTALSILAVIGVYNAVVINSQSEIDGNVQFLKRVDEVYGVTTPGRTVAAVTKWKKLPQPVKRIPEPQVAITSAVTSEPKVAEVPAAITEELDLTLVEVSNPKKWSKGLTQDQFSGSLKTADGVIEGLNITLPNEDGFTVSFSELSGNVFEYDYNGEIVSGMIYQVDKQNYMVSLSNGPLEGTRFKFAAPQAPSEEPALSFDTVSYQF